MNNLPAGVLYDSRAPWNLPDMPHGMEECGDCCELYSRLEMYSFERYSWIHRRMEEVQLCEACVPRCGWKVCSYDEPCHEPAISNSEGGWCAKHDRAAEELDAEEELGGQQIAA